MNDYEYEKEFIIEKQLLDKVIYLEFEGVYKDAEIYINGKFVIKEVWMMKTLLSGFMWVKF